MNNLLVVLVSVVAVMSLIAWFDARCLADLANTGDRDLRYFKNRYW